MIMEPAFLGNREGELCAGHFEADARAATFLRACPHGAAAEVSGDAFRR
jgi:hypothetical protein